MSKEYKTYIGEEITKEVLDSIKVGDLVKGNGLKRPLRVVGVSENYFLMTMKAFNNVIYSVCEKKIWGYNRNGSLDGYFRCGPDDSVFGSGSVYSTENDFEVKEYLEEFEKGVTQLSIRRAVSIRTISIKEGVL